MTNRRQLLDEIKPSMKLTTGFFLKVYGYDLTWPGFAENVLSRMKILGCSKARDYYTAVVATYEHNHEKELKAAAEWYKKRCDLYHHSTRQQAERCMGKKKDRGQL